jgi:hypothetical protein
MRAAAETETKAMAGVAAAAAAARRRTTGKQRLGHPCD